MRRILLGLLGSIVVLVLAGLGLGYWLLLPTNPASTENVTFVVPKGQAVSVMANRLAEKNLIKHPMVFRYVVWRDGLTKKLQAGSFELSPASSSAQIAERLTQGTNDVWVTIQEGLRREEIAELLAQQELSAFSKEEFLNQTAGLEGQLFPDTYLVPREITAAALVSLLTRTYQEKQITENQAALSLSKRTEREVLVLASLVEREAIGQVQMQLVASILAKRLEIGMPLQVDATLQYAKGYDGTDWWPTPLAADKTIVSPFNTYLNAGLPPAPICNPGTVAFQAALDPQPTDYLFYLHDQQGKIHLAKTLDEHNLNVNQYLR